MLGMVATAVNPPAAAAALPLAMVSLASKPGSRKWTCESIQPGVTSMPPASREGVPAGGCSPVPAARTAPSSIQTSPTASMPFPGSRMRPLRMARVSLIGCSDQGFHEIQNLPLPCESGWDRESGRGESPGEAHLRGRFEPGEAA